MSEAEAERLGGPQLKREPELVEWRNPRTDRTMRIDRGLDPSWANNPGRDRPRLVQEAANAKIAELGLLLPAAAREAVRQIVGSPLLDRQFAPLKPGETLGDLPVAYVPPQWWRRLGLVHGVAFVTKQTARKQRRLHHGKNKQWPDDIPLTIDDYRVLLPRVIEHPTLVLYVETHRGHKVNTLVFCRRSRRGWHKAAIRGTEDGSARLSTFHHLSAEDVRALADDPKTEIVMDSRD